MIKRLGFIFLAMVFGFCIISAQNEDTPNLSFENGSFENWTLYTGGYYFDDNDGKYKYDWEEDPSSPTIRLMNDVETPDPIVACNDLNIVPKEASLVARIGNPLEAENMPVYATCATRAAAYKARAERMTYSFIVSKNTTLLTYRFATILHIPIGEDAGKHTGGQYPTFSINVDVVDTMTGVEAIMPCGAYEAKATDSNSGLTRMDSCENSEAGDRATEYVYRNWTTASYDLRNQIGKRVTVDIKTHDCLLDLSASGCSPYISHIANCAGGHEAYGYVYAQTRKLELISKNCGESDPILEAPEGFPFYNWYRSDGRPITIPDPNQPRIALIERENINDGVTYFCEIASDMSGCSSITLSTQLEKIQFDLSFEKQDSCGGLVKFKNTSKITQGSDTISYYKWDLGDGYVSSETNPQHYYDSTGTYTIKLKAFSSYGCEDSIKTEINILDFPKLKINGDSKYCYGDEVNLTINNAPIGSIIEWSNGNTGMILKDSAKTSQTYIVEVTDKYSCIYEDSIHIRVYPLPEVSIKGKSEVCPGDSVTITAISNASSFKWNIGNDSSSITIFPVSKTTYTVVGTDDNGCKGMKSFDVDVLTPPIISIDGPDDICEGSTATLTANGGRNYRWKRKDWVTEYDGETLTISGDTSIRYYVTGYDEKGCHSQSTKYIPIKKVPIVRIGGDSIVCQGAFIHLNASGATSYKWSDNSTKNSFLQTMENDVIISVEGTTNGCTGKDDRLVKMKPAPSIWIDGITDICYNDSLHLAANSADSITYYKWDNGPSTVEMDALPKFSSKYRVTGTGANGCTSSAVADVNVWNLPIINVSGDPAVCENTEAHLKASGDAEIFYWEGSTLGAEYNPIVPKDTTYYVEGTDSNGCTNRAYIKVKAIPYPEIKITGDSVVCYGTFHQLVAKGAASYQWNNGPSTPSYGITPTESQTYSVTGTLNGCSSSANFFVEVLQLPTIWIEGLTQICHGDSLFLVAKGAETYNWGEGTLKDQLNTLPFSSTTYKLSGTDENKCTNQIDVPITVLSKPDINIKGETMVCINTQADLTASDGCEVYAWNNGNSGKNIQPTITKKDTFSVLGIDLYGCKNKASIVISPLDPPELSILGDTVVCLGKSTTLVAQGAQTYLWPDSSTSAQYNLTPASNMTFILEGTAQKCTAQKEIHIFIKLPPNVLISGDESICPGTPFTLSASGATRYKWNTGDTTTSISYLPQTTTTYSVIGYDSLGCNTKSDYVMNVFQTPDIKIDMQQRIGCLDSQDTLHLKAFGGVFYTWSSDPSWPELATNINSEEMEVFISKATLFKLKGVDSNGCVGYAQMAAEMLPRQDFSYVIEPKLIEPDNPTVLFKGNVPVNSKWFWTPSIGEPELEGKSLKHSYNTKEIGDSVSITIRALDANGCEYLETETLYVWKPFWAPTAITPNADEKNERFRFYGGQYIDNFSFIIYNRLGQIVFEGDSMTDEWDGRFKGEPCPIGLYGWVAKFKSNYKGIDKSGEERGYFSIVK
ncbi:MAG TPA: PKD domain-containing protein [Paludibacteraceae bacterium]|nr:PKD domain-containing protein [Paludibacteraceae bacterium]